MSLLFFSFMFHPNSKLVNHSFYLFGSNRNRHLVCKNVFVDQTMHIFKKVPNKLDFFTKSFAFALKFVD